MTRAISTTSRRDKTNFFFSARQGAEEISRHSDRSIRGICTIVCHRPKRGVPVKTWCFFHLDAPRPGRPKTVTTPGFIDQIHELNLEGRRISAKSKSENLAI
jgi:hypothetical protein